LLEDPADLQKGSCGGENRSMPKNSRRSPDPLNSDRLDPDRPSAGKSFPSPFTTGSIVVVTLGNPRDKFWGAILSLAPEGLSVSGIELASFEDLVAMVKDNQPFNPAIVFFPMHRIERIELDLPDGNLPSLSQRFTTKTGLDPAVSLTSSLSLVNMSGDHDARAGRRPA
jgi:hypothetical protein